VSTTSAGSADIDGVTVSTDHFIGGERVSSPTTFEDRSPLDWSIKLADVARGDASTADAAVSAAAAAFPGWAALGSAGRGEIMRRLADLIDANVERIATVECHDMAMLHESLRLRVIARGARNFRAYAELAEAYEERVWDSNGTRNRVLRMPAGPTVVITPWNAPFMLSTWKCAPALAAGNTVILKPAEWSPLSASILADLADEAGMPPGVFNVVQGIGEEVGDALVRDPRLRRISFTGSPETARSIGTAAAQNIVPFTAELGGKGPFIVFADADIDAAAAKAAGQYDDSGQVCLAGTRLIVEASIREEFLAKFNACTDAHVLGDSRDSATTISAMIHPDHLAQRRRVRRACSGRLATRSCAVGSRWTNTTTGTEGLWYEPTLDRAIVERQRSGPTRDLRTGAHLPDVRRLKPTRSTWRTRRTTGCPRSCTRHRASEPSVWVVPFAPARSGRTASWCAI
jgi:acyl-CoA reductase-like NAD-dependent aldehyde dehydrogenase